MTLYICLASFLVPAVAALYYRVDAGRARDAANLARAELTTVERDRDSWKASTTALRDRNERLVKVSDAVLSENSVLRAKVVDRLRPEEVLPALNEAFGVTK